LSIRDALSLRRTDIYEEKGFHRVVTHRQKTGTHVSAPIPSAIAAEVLAVPNRNPEYIFFTGASKGDNHTTEWQTRYIAPVFKAAGLYDDGRMVSHRLRDTFAVGLLEKGFPMEEGSRLLGHESIKTIEKHYARWSKVRQERVDSLVAGT
jgi:integrase/recombinase XerD